ncbi:MAG: hypothetical protein APF76_17635 [Desulfitibacter sp. BRH_c19]|nr:MAG: hypothetical protein APF76_17635 [Desulfitibacter sp. BRH_c19]
MKKSIIIAIAIICLLTIIKLPALSQQENINPFDTLYQLEEVQFSELKICAWAKIKNKISTKKQLEDILFLLEKEYNVELNKQWENDKNYQSVSGDSDLNLDLNDNKEIINIKLTATQAETYLSINLDNLSMDNRLIQRKRLEGIFGYFEVTPDISETAIYYIPRYLTVSEQEQIVHTIFDKINGIIIEGIKDEVLVSYSGFTPYFSDSVEVAGRKINVNIASRYHNLDDKTYLYMGTPLIHCQY